MELGIIGSEKISTQALKVDIREFKGMTGVDIRRCYKVGNDWRHTVKGVWLQPFEVKQAITFLERAEAELIKRGILKTT